ncbi:hypothetical protein [Streptomyces sp. T028]|uniref:hypothetical protein n=1 Tax=Streptomyces sp. T028 TaxID=3394379 RepID=UPI003A842F62
MTDLSTSTCADDTTLPAVEPSDLEVAVSVAQQLLDSDQILSLREALRLLLRALDAEPDTETPAPALSPAMTELHRLCRQDYESSADRRAQDHRDDTHLIEDPGTGDPVTAYDPLHTPNREPSGPFHLDVEIAVTRRILDETAGLNIHDDVDMQKAAFALNARLRCLFATIESERGERP